MQTEPTTTTTVAPIGALDVAPTATVTQTAEPKVEPATVTPEPKVEDPISDKFAALARKEKAVVKARQEMAASKAEFERQQREFAAKQAEFERWTKLKENAKLDPDSYLNEAGLSYGYLTERSLKGGVDPNAILEKTTQKITEWEQRQKEAQKKAQEDAQKASEQEYKERVTNFVKGIHDFVDQNKETYELTSLHGQQMLVWEVIAESANRGEEITVKDAAAKVEKYLEEQVEKALSAKKFKDRFAKKEEEKKVVSSTPTLSNQMTQTTPTTGNRILSERERIANAELALKKAFGEV